MFSQACVKNSVHSSSNVGYCISETNQKELVSLNGIPVLIGSLGDPSDSEELNQAIKYVLQACASTGNGMQVSLPTLKLKATKMFQLR